MANEDKPEWLRDRLALTLKERRTRILLTLCGAFMGHNEATLILQYVDEGLARDHVPSLREAVYGARGGTPPPPHKRGYA